MSIEFTIRKGSTNPTSGSGITLGEPAFNYSNNTLWIGKGYDVTAAWVGAGICGASGGIAAGLSYQIPTLGAVKDYFTAVSSNFLGTTAAYVASFNGRTGAVQGVSAAVAGTGISVSGATGSVTITNTGVQSFNGNTGAVTGASLGANTFTALNTFSAGISAAGGVTFSGTFSGTTAAFSKLLSASGGVSAGGNVLFNAVTAVFGASAANTTPITIYKDNAADNPGVDNFGTTIFDTPNNKVPLTLSFTEVYDPNQDLTDLPGSTMIRVRNQTSSTDTFTVTDKGNIVCADITCGNINPVSYTGNITLLGGNALELSWDGSAVVPPAEIATVLSIYNDTTPGYDLKLLGNGTFSKLTTSGTVTGVTGSFSGNITAKNIVNSVNGVTGDIRITGLDFVLFNLGII